MSILDRIVRSGPGGMIPVIPQAAGKVDFSGKVACVNRARVVKERITGIDEVLARIVYSD